MKKEVNIFDYASLITDAMQHGGILLTTKAGNQVNTMTIGWGTLGVEWKKPVFTAFIRESRYTKEMLDQNGEFTVNIPLKGSCSREVLAHCGKVSGREEDKISALGLTLVDGEAVSVPAIQELPLTIECRVLFRQVQDPSVLPQEIQDRFYPVKNGKQDPHVAFFGEILKAYIL